MQDVPVVDQPPADFDWLQTCLPQALQRRMLLARWLAYDDVLDSASGTTFEEAAERRSVRLITLLAEVSANDAQMRELRNRAGLARAMSIIAQHASLDVTFAMRGARGAQPAGDGAPHIADWRDAHGVLLVPLRGEEGELLMLRTLRAWLLENLAPYALPHTKASQQWGMLLSSVRPNFEATYDGKTPPKPHLQLTYQQLGFASLSDLLTWQPFNHWFRCSDKPGKGGAGGLQRCATLPYISPPRAC
jgi:hypothetical protein